MTRNAAVRGGCGAHGDRRTKRARTRGAAKREALSHQEGPEAPEEDSVRTPKLKSGKTGTLGARIGNSVSQEQLEALYRAAGLSPKRAAARADYRGAKGVQ